KESPPTLYLITEVALAPIPFAYVLPIKINGKTYAKGISANATSVIKYNVGGGYGTFKAVIGIDDVQNKKGTATTLYFEVLGDGFSLYKSPTMNTVNGPAAGIPIEL